MSLAETLIRDAEFDLKAAVAELEDIFNDVFEEHAKAVERNPLAFIGLTHPVQPTLHLKDYVDLSAATVQVPTALAPQPLPAGFSWGMLANDTLGDCVIAMMLHSIEMFFISVGETPPAFTDQDAIAMYSAITGYTPSDPNSDQGTDEGQAFDYWAATGLTCAADHSTHKIAASVAVDPTDRNMRHLGIFEFDAIQYAIQLPLTWQGASSWTGVPSDSDPNSQPGSWGGHGVPARAYDATGAEDILTWSMDLTADGDSLDAYLAQASIIVTQEQVNTKTGISRCGVSWDDLVSDIKKLGNNPVQ